MTEKTMADLINLDLTGVPEDGGDRFNRLIFEKSPYLLQHALQPVEWYPWGDRAFQKAKDEDKPILLSIGYASCHWCHVMAHESFEDETVAAMINRDFVAIKVDREERPDVDHTYMTACQVFNGGGGWPLTAFLTPDGKPFFVGTYFPKQRRMQHMGMVELLPRLARMWKEERPQLDDAAERLTSFLREREGRAGQPALDEGVLHAGFKHFSGRFDRFYGGFGNAPKFPSPHQLMFLLRYYKRTGDEHALLMVETTLKRMRWGGLFDQVGFGFHRYATDRTWLLPHFEKMLYDQAMMVLVYTEAFQATQNPLYRETALQVAAYVLRDLTESRGAFLSAEDADSEGHEGRFYTWSWEEIRWVLGQEDAEWFGKVMNARPQGNFREEATGTSLGLNILHQTRDLAEWANELGWTEDSLAKKVEAMRVKLFQARERRTRPFRDDKVLTDWNGLMIAALARAGRALNEPHLVDAARQAAVFVCDHLMTPEGRLWKRYRDGEAGLPGCLDDYAFLTWGLLELYEASFEVGYLQQASALMNITLDLFFDREQGGFFMTSREAEALIFKSKEAYDGAIPSGNSVSLMNLIRLARMTGNVEMEEKAQKVFQAFAGTVATQPMGHAFLLCALDFAMGPSMEIVIAGPPRDQGTEQMLQAVFETFVPNKVVLFHRENGQGALLEKMAPFLTQQTSQHGKATAYVCQGQACRAPTTDVNEMRALIAGVQSCIEADETP